MSHRASAGTGAAAEALVRAHEQCRGRRLLDPCLGGWEDLDSEAVLLARNHWRRQVPSTHRYWARGRYLSFDDAGRAERLVDIHEVNDHQPAVVMRQQELLIAAELGHRYWLYVLTLTLPAELPDRRSPTWSLKTLQGCVGLPWQPSTASATTGAGSGGLDQMWTLPASSWLGERSVPPAA